MPALLEFEVPMGARYFTLEVSGNRIHQGLLDRAQVPPTELAGHTARPAAPSRSETPPIPEGHDVLARQAPPARPAASPPAPAAPAAEPQETGEWQDIDLEMAKPEQPPDIQLEPPREEE